MVSFIFPIYIIINIYSLGAKLYISATCIASRSRLQRTVTVYVGIFMYTYIHTYILECTHADSHSLANTYTHTPVRYTSRRQFSQPLPHIYASFPPKSLFYFNLSATVHMNIWIYTVPCVFSRCFCSSVVWGFWQGKPSGNCRIWPIFH